MGWVQPTATAVVTSGYGPRKPVKTSKGTSSAFHNGTDYRAPTGTNVRAVGDGTVSVVAEHNLRGLYVVIAHDDGTSTLYQHLSRQLVKRGDVVKGGHVIGKAGRTGNVTGAHLHLEAYDTKSGTRTDPVPYLAARIKAQEAMKKAPASKSTPAAGKSVRSTGRGCGGRIGSHPLTFGTVCPCVRELQRILNAWYPAKPGRRQALAVDGSYGGLTRARVLELQTRAGITRDGMTGPETFRVLGVRVAA